MADQFDIVDIVYNAVEPASTGFILYKDQSGDGEKRNHITIRSLALNGKDYVNKGSININIFVKRPSKCGERVTAPWVRIPVFPLDNYDLSTQNTK